MHLKYINKESNENKIAIKYTKHSLRSSSSTTIRNPMKIGKKRIDIFEIPSKISYILMLKYCACFENQDTMLCFTSYVTEYSVHFQIIERLKCREK